MNEKVLDTNYTLYKTQMEDIILVKGLFIGFLFDHLYHNIVRDNSYNTMYEYKKD